MQFLAQNAHVLRGWFVLRVERNQNLAVGGANRRTITESQINSANRESDIVQNIADLV